MTDVARRTLNNALSRAALSVALGLSAFLVLYVTAYMVIKKS